ncbi:MAG TPA: cytochrome C, partial [Shewanella sp.]|nr:cytochrome C [Shewanella sp.]
MKKSTLFIMGAVAAMTAQAQAENLPDRQAQLPSSPKVQGQEYLIPRP